LFTVFGLLNIKSLIFGLLLASPALAAWAYFGSGAVDSARVSAQVLWVPADRPLAEPLRIPVEVIAKGSAPQWVYVEVPPQAIPEPGYISLLALAGVLLVFHRARQEVGPIYHDAILGGGEDCPF